MTDPSTLHPGLPPADLLNAPRFNEPPGWRWHHFTSSRGYRLRYGSVYPSDSIADAVIVCLPGLRDFAEQYFELAHAMLGRNFAFWVLDWRGQGGSDRYLKNRHRRHAGPFEADMLDLQELVEGYILPSAVHPDVGRLPLVMLGHSMGAHLGLRYLREHNVSAKGKQSFSAGAFVAPMFWIDTLDKFSLHAIKLLSGLMCIAPRAYVPNGEDWTPRYRDRPFAAGKYSHDPARAELQDAWFTKNPDLQIGSPTNRWLHEAAKSCITLNKPDYLAGINVPTLFLSAGNDRIVSNRMIAKSTPLIRGSRHIEIPGAEHELLMEADQYRQPVLDHFFSFVDENVLKKFDRGLTKF